MSVSTLGRSNPSSISSWQGLDKQLHGLGTVPWSILEKIGEFLGFSVENKTNKRGEIDLKMASVMNQVATKKAEKKEVALKDRFSTQNVGNSFKNFIFLLGGGLSFVYLILEVIKTISSSVEDHIIAEIVTISSGFPAGLITFTSSMVGFLESYQAYKNGDMTLAARLAFSSLIGTAIGIVLMGATISVTASFLGNPIFLPILFFLGSLPILYELYPRIKGIMNKTDLASSLRLEELEDKLKRTEESKIKWEDIFKLFENFPNDQAEKHLFDLRKLRASLEEKKVGDKEIAEEFSKIIEKLQAGMGVIAAIEAARLIQNLLQYNKKRILSQINRTREKIKEWNKAQKVRLLQQGLSWLAVSAGLGGNSAISYASMGSSTGIGFYMDAKWPDKRNTPVVVPKVEADEVS